MAVRSAKFAFSLTTVGLIVIAAPVSAQVTDGINTVTVTRENLGPYRPRWQPEVSKVSESIFEQTNKFRRQQKRPELVRNETLDKTAQEFADYMARTGRYGHYADERSVSDRVRDHQYDFCLILENIALQFKSIGFTTGELPNLFLAGWKNSPGHRANMLHDAVTEMGVGVAQSADTGACFAVQLFARPKSAAIVFEIANQTNEVVAYQLGDETHELPPRQIRKHTLCLQAELSLQKSAGEDGLPAVTPRSGDAFEITSAAPGKRSLSRQEPAAAP